MRFGMILPGGTAPEQLEQAVLAEESGWDGVFVWEAAYGVDAWGLLSAMAAQTSRIKLGTMLTPLPWRRPWKVAGQVATLDQLSNGRAILAVGLGAVETDLPSTGEELDLRIRAAMMDEGIDLIRTLWDGGQSYQGEHYTYESVRDDLTVVGRPVQERIPIWVVGAWPRPKSMRRVLRCDGVLPQYAGEASPGRADRAACLAERARGPAGTRRGGGGGDRPRHRRSRGEALGGRRRYLVAGNALGPAASLTRAHGAGPQPPDCGAS
ncbi:LLM class flavin-dependent oxidoreductase [Kribbella sp. DT2]|uniref:LLM class flavin-dependent oxidoreductase n=1 Tax=Kribbella sp. DT2 TaxID=3393427 RepID=UPI003CECFDFC